MNIYASTIELAKAKYNEDPAVSAILTEISFVTTAIEEIVEIIKLYPNPYGAPLSGIRGEDGYSPITFGSDSFPTLGRDMKMYGELRAFTVLFTVLVSILQGKGEEIDY